LDTPGSAVQMPTRSIASQRQPTRNVVTNLYGDGEVKSTGPEEKFEEGLTPPLPSPSSGIREHHSGINVFESTDERHVHSMRDQADEHANFSGQVSTAVDDRKHNLPMISAQFSTVNRRPTNSQADSNSILDV